jgi:HEAT repeat protein
MIRMSEIRLWLRWNRIVEGLVNVLKHAGEPDIRWWVVDTLGVIRDPVAVEPLVEALLDEHSGVRRGAAWALGHIRSKKAIEPLAKVLENDKDWRVRLAAALVLGKIGDERAIGALRGAISQSYSCEDADHMEEEFRVAEAAQKAIDRIVELS